MFERLLESERERKASITPPGVVAHATAGPALVVALEDPRDRVRTLNGDALIALGPRAVRPLLDALAQRGRSTALYEAAFRVLRVLANRHELRFLEPVLYALKDSAPADQVPPAASRALQRCDAGAAED
ncbi:MAG: hypothetical protein U1E76_16580 [Planctomycetota bacterium]